MVHADGHESVTAASRFGTLKLSRQVCQHADSQPHVMPGNAVLPPHNGMIITRGLQEWTCLLPQELSFATVARLLGVPDSRAASAIRYQHPHPSAHPRT